MELRERKARNTRDRYARAAGVLPKMTLGKAEAVALLWIKAQTGETKAAIVRRLLREAGQSNPGISSC